MLKFFKRHKQKEELVSVEDYLEILKESPLDPSSAEFLNAKKWVDSQMLPVLGKLVSGPVKYIIAIPTSEELLDEIFSGQWEMVDDDYFIDKEYFYFWHMYGITPDEGVIIVDLITQVLNYYGYKVTWKCSGRNIIFTISLP